MPLKTEVRYIELPTGPFAPVLHVLLLGRDALEARLVVAVAFEKLSARIPVNAEKASQETISRTRLRPSKSSRLFRLTISRIVLKSSSVSSIKMAAPWAPEVFNISELCHRVTMAS